MELQLENIRNVADSLKVTRLYNLNLTADRGTLFTLYPADRNKEMLCSFSFSYKVGTIKPKVDNSIIYLLPFKENKKVTIYEGKRFDVKPDVWKRYMVYSDTKDTIYAMRKGVVVDIRKFAVNDNENITGQSGVKYRTEVIIEHADGTLASYSGLDEASLFVSLNQTINPHARIGVVDTFGNAGQNQNFSFNIYYFYDEETEDYAGKKTRIIEKSVMPKFLTTSGKVKLLGKSDYKGLCNAEVMSQELNIEEKGNANNFIQ